MQVRKDFRKSVRKEAAKQYNDGNLSNTDKVALLALAGIVDKGTENIRVLIPVTTVRVYNTYGNKTAEEIVNELKGHSTYDLSRQTAAANRESVVHFDQIEGLPEPEAPEPETPETVESILAEIDKAKQDIRAWVKQRRDRWCDSGVDTALDNVGIDKLPKPKVWNLTRPLAGGAGTASLNVLAESEEEAQKLADWSTAVIKGAAFADDKPAVSAK